MRCLIYSGSGSEENCAALTEYCKMHGVVPEGILCEKDGSFSAVRKLQTSIKLGFADTVLTASYVDLARDEYLRLELFLFIRRNDARLFTLDRSGPDPRHGITNAVKRSVSCITDWDESYGREMPSGLRGREFRRVPPIGYKVVEGRAAVSEQEAETVRRIFISYAGGAAIHDICAEVNALLPERRFGNMTVKTVLRNERYLGRASKKSYALPPIITYDLWLEAAERLEREYGPSFVGEPLKAFIKADKPFCMQRAAGMDNAVSLRGAGYVIDSASLERALTEAFIKAYEGASDALMEYVSKQRKKAEAALGEAVAEYGDIQLKFIDGLKRLRAGERSPELLDELDSLADAKNVLGMRKRRVASELELFSLERSSVDRFFERAARFDRLSFEERGFIADALVKRIRIAEGKVTVRLISPDGGYKRIKLEGVTV